ncbi:MAG: DUF3299 domain-containing protein [Pseudomonadota bacterium]
MKNKISGTFLSYTFIAAFAMAVFASGYAQAIQKIEWKNLLPELPALKDPLAGLTQDQRFDIETIAWARGLKPEDLELIQNQQGIEDGKTYEEQFKKAGIDVDDLLAKYQAWQRKVEIRQNKVNTSLDGKEIRMPGYLLPLEFSEDGDTDFLLVPYIGACIHVPPPPPNQIVFVRLSSKFKVNEVFMAVWITGKMKTRASSKTLSFIDGTADISVAYHLEGTTVIPYQE